MAHIEKLSAEDSNDHFKNRSKEKNALAISSDQSKKIHSYEEVVDNYNKVLNSERDLKKDHPIGEVILLNLIILNFGKAMIQELIKEEFSKK